MENAEIKNLKLKTEITIFVTFLIFRFSYFTKQVVPYIGINISSCLIFPQLLAFLLFSNKFLITFILYPLSMPLRW